MASVNSGPKPIAVSPFKKDAAWGHCQMYKTGDRTQLKCLYCYKVFCGGGIHRIKEHLACHKGNASCCTKVPDDVRDAMLESLQCVIMKRKKRQKIDEEIRGFTPSSNEIDNRSRLVEPLDMLESSSGVVTRGKDLGRRKKGRVESLPPNVAPDVPGHTTSNVLPLSSRRDKEHVHMAIARFLYDVGLPLHAVNSPYFQPMINAVASNGTGLEATSYHELRGWVLKNSLDEVNGLVDRYKGAWGRIGCSVLADEWTTESGRTLLNIFVYCSEGAMFFRSFDVSDTVHSSGFLYELLKGVVEEIGASNVLQVITDGTEHYADAGKMLTDTFRTVFWTPCAARSVNLILEDIGKIEWINMTLQHAKSITRFIYNHGTLLNMMRRHTSGKDLVQPSITRSGTDFLTLKSMVHLRDNIQVMVNSQEWIDCSLSKDPEGISMMDIILSQSFWSSCSTITHLTDALVSVLRSVGSIKYSAGGYILAGMHQAKEAIKNELYEKNAYMFYWNIIDSRCEQQLQHPLHEASFFLNPRLFYSLQGEVRDKIPSGMLDCIERLVPDINIQDKINQELISYKNATGDFGRKMAMRAMQTLLPAEWWSTYGGGCPNLARLAIRILSQTCSARVCELSSFPFEQFHKSKNHLERQRICDLIFVQCNLQLQQINLRKERDPGQMDPISTDSIDLTEDWVTEKMGYFGSGDADWVALHQPVANSMLLDSPSDEAENLVAGFNYWDRPNAV